MQEQRELHEKFPSCMTRRDLGIWRFIYLVLDIFKMAQLDTVTAQP